MSAIRILFLALCLAIAGQAAAQSTVVPIANFIDVPVAHPTTTARVKAAIVRSALNLWWDVVEESDGSLIVSQTKPNDYAFKFKVSYDANKYSVTYLDSTSLRFNDGRLIDGNSVTYSGYATQNARLYVNEPETPFLVRSTGYIHPFYEKSVRQLMGSVRRHLNAPI
jgi:hypothetical protein